MHVRIGETTAQDLTLDLGPPLRVHYRDDERLKIHAASSKLDPDNGTGCECFDIHGAIHIHSIVLEDFYNYFQHGMDFLISETTHIVKKIILHTNVVKFFLINLLSEFADFKCKLKARFFHVPEVQKMQLGNRGYARGRRRW